MEVELEKITLENECLKYKSSIQDETIKNINEKEQIQNILINMIKGNVDTLIYFKGLLNKTDIVHEDIQKLVTILKKNQRYVPELPISINDFLDFIFICLHFSTWKCYLIILVVFIHAY